MIELPVHYCVYRFCPCGAKAFASLAINDSWRCVLKTKRIEQTDTLETLKLIVCDDDVWNLSSDFSNKTLVDRCDRLKCANGMDTSGLKSLNHLTDAQMTYVSVGAIVAFVFLQQIEVGLVPSLYM
uniref:Uncharacterized protein n=1 Tax=Ditylenchus dipsaci TaxID=166011 RepID=A0A915D6V5_9BILA